jgi:hypothetical protein
LKDLWRDHFFEPLLEWINGKLAISEAVGLYGSPFSGWTHAKLILNDDLDKRTAPDIRLPLRVPQQ